ncbi:MAG: 4Fe-4S dicluster domain-containing protein [Actinobacteria bacterium]|jgi:NAD-dependent dihydropyrimidine dehydrogenase PreA subunit|nr:4Fe-4S dicluster domain-containing protein [Actinomycetota bacterium]
MATRKIIEIDRDLCDGCGLCTTACAEGALELDEEGKAVLVRDMYCDGMGVCLDVCPTGALKIIEREGDEYDPEAAREHVINTRGPEAAAAVHPGPGAPLTQAPSELTQWPVQLHLISPQAPYFKGSDLLVAADCTAFTRGSFHADLLRGRKLVVACPKLDDTSPYVEKLAELIRTAEPKSITVARMTVPCCSGLMRLVERAVEAAGVEIPVRTVLIGLDGEFVQES